MFVIINNDEVKCRWECNKLIDKGVCDKKSIWNPSNSECECDKSCDVGEYLDYENCNCSKKLVNKLAVECTENIDEVKTAGMVFLSMEMSVYVLTQFPLSWCLFCLFPLVLKKRCYLY